MYHNLGGEDISNTPMTPRSYNDQFEGQKYQHAVTQVSLKEKVGSMFSKVKLGIKGRVQSLFHKENAAVSTPVRSIDEKITSTERIQKMLGQYFSVDSKGFPKENIDTFVATKNIYIKELANIAEEKNLEEFKLSFKKDFMVALLSSMMSRKGMSRNMIVSTWNNIGSTLDKELEDKYALLQEHIESYIVEKIWVGDNQVRLQSLSVNNQVEIINAKIDSSQQKKNVTVDGRQMNQAKALSEKYSEKKPGKVSEVADFVSKNDILEACYYLVREQSVFGKFHGDNNKRIKEYAAYISTLNLREKGYMVEGLEKSNDIIADTTSYQLNRYLEKNLEAGTEPLERYQAISSIYKKVLREYSSEDIKNFVRSALQIMEEDKNSVLEIEEQGVSKETILHAFCLAQKAVDNANSAYGITAEVSINKKHVLDFANVILMLPSINNDLSDYPSTYLKILEDCAITHGRGTDRLKTFSAPMAVNKTSSKSHSVA